MKKLALAVYLIAFLLSSLQISCKDKTIVDYRVTLNYVFINNTKYKIAFNEEANVLDLAPFSKSIHSITTEGPKDLKKEDFRSSPVEILCKSCIIYFDDIGCDTLKGKGIENIDNFEFTKIKQGHYELKYIFNESDFLSSKNCK
jgi:hypothetical protein